MTHLFFLILFSFLLLFSNSLLIYGQTDSPRIKISPDMLFYTNREISSTTTIAIVIKNLGSGVLIIEKIESFSNDYQLRTTEFPIEILPNKFARINVDFIPTSLGEKLGYLIIHSNDPQNPTIKYKLFGAGVEKNATGGGCLIATATFGSELAPQVQQLREIRDGIVLKTESGTSFMAGFNQFYYSFSPIVSDWERQSPEFKQVVKIIITPLLRSLSILNHVDIDSEQEMLGYGIGIILINIGMYFAAPLMLFRSINNHYFHLYPPNKFQFLCIIKRHLKI